MSNDPDLFSHQTRTNHKLIAQLRCDSPVLATTVPGWGTKHWFLLAYDDCNAVLRDPRIGRNLLKNLSKDLLKKWPPPPHSEQMVDQHLLSFDPPEHTRMRKLVQEAFTNRQIRRLQDRVQVVADKLIDEVIDVGEMDLVEQYAFMIPITLITDILGVPMEDHLRFRSWVRHLFGTGEETKRMVAATEFVQYMNECIDERREEPRDDVLSGMVQARDVDDHLTHQELISMTFLLLTAGFETTIHLIGSGVYNLLRHPDQLDFFRSEMSTNTDLVKTTIEEIIRYDGPATTTFMRWAWEDIELNEKKIARGDAIHPILSAANRDPAVFANPDNFDITRRPNKHLGFGAGVHYCLGAPLARMEGMIALPTLFRRLPDLQLAVDIDQLVWDTGTLHGLEALPVRW